MAVLCQSLNPIWWSRTRFVGYSETMNHSMKDHCCCCRCRCPRLDTRIRATRTRTKTFEEQEGKAHGVDGRRASAIVTTTMRTLPWLPRRHLDWPQSSSRRNALQRGIESFVVTCHCDGSEKPRRSEKTFLESCRWWWLWRPRQPVGALALYWNCETWRRQLP